MFASIKSGFNCQISEGVNVASSAKVCFLMLNMEEPPNKATETKHKYKVGPTSYKYRGVTLFIGVITPVTQL